MWRSKSRIVVGAASLLAVALLSGAAVAQHQPVFKLLHAFGGGGDGKSADGITPSSGVVFDEEGNLYGTTTAGGAYGYGTVYQLSPQQDGTWTETILHSFPNTLSTTDGSEPSGGVVIDSAGSLYGTTTLGGTNGSGTIFELTPSGSGWAETILYNFCSLAGCADGAVPRTAPVLDPAGNLYGGTNAAPGTVYELTPTPGGWDESVLYTFCSQPQCWDGVLPGAVVRDGAGNLYGPAEGGSTGGGVVFAVTPPQSPGGTWSERVLHTFRGGSDGAFPMAVTLHGNALYGTTLGGGGSAQCMGGCGAVFELTSNPTGDLPRETILHAFGNSADGIYPVGGLAFDRAGNIYGVTSFGGAPCSCGVVYELERSPVGTTWQYEVLHRFAGPDGIEPGAGLTIDGKGNLYGTTIGGANGGVVFELTP